MPEQKIIHGKSEIELKPFADNLFDSCVTDPPYGLEFMGKKWDYDVPTVEQWKEVWRVLKPGAHMLVACGTRTQHRMVCNIEDAGFSIRDVITWHYGSGFPKSFDISKAIDKSKGLERNIISKAKNPAGSAGSVMRTGLKNEFNITEPASDEAKEWQGWGTGLKPATEFWTLARKPIVENSIAENVLKYGTGALNIDGCRISFKNIADQESATWGRGTDIIGGNYVGATHGNGKENIEPNELGRFPANLIIDDFIAELLDEQTDNLKSGSNAIRSKEGFFVAHGGFGKAGDIQTTYGDEGGASRFFYCAKADGYEKNKGLNDFEKKSWKEQGYRDNESSHLSPRAGAGRTSEKANHHPTVKPIDLMRYLIKLITPKNGHVLDPFNGSGTTGIAAKLEFMNYTGFEMDADYCKISEARINAWNPDLYKEQKLF